LPDYGGESSHWAQPQRLVLGLMPVPTQKQHRYLAQKMHTVIPARKPTACHYGAYWTCRARESLGATQATTG